eukprot:gene2190-3097_t
MRWLSTVALARSIGEGTGAVVFKGLDEEYVVTWPTAYARGIIVGSLLMELGGKVSISCKATQLATSLEFKVPVLDSNPRILLPQGGNCESPAILQVKGYFSGEYNRVCGSVHPVGQ